MTAGSGALVAANGLAFEASARVASVALLAGRRGGAADRVIAAVEIAEVAGAARHLAAAAEDLLARLALAPAALDFVAVGIGPGAYTGTRMALATAKTLAAVLRIPILGVPSTAALACAPGTPATGCILAAVDARQGLLYGALYRRAGGASPRPLEQPFLRAVDQVLPLLARADFVAGDGLHVLAQAQAAPVHGDAGLLPRASEVLSIAADRFSRGERDEERILLPLYLRASEAEIRFAARAGGEGGRRG